MAFSGLAVLRRLFMAEHRRFLRRIIWACFLVWGALVAIKSVPYYSYMSAALDAVNEGDFSKGEDLYGLALKEAHAFNGLNDSRRLHVHLALADLFASELRYTEAERLYLESLDFEKEKHGINNLGTAEINYKLASVYFRQGRYAAAASLLQQTLAIRQKQLGAKHYLVAITKFALARTLSCERDGAAADKLYIEAIADWPEATVRDKAGLKACLREYAIFLRRQGRAQEARAFEEQFDQIDVPSLTNVKKEAVQFAYLVTGHIFDRGCTTYPNSYSQLINGELVPSVVALLQRKGLLASSEESSEQVWSSLNARMEQCLIAIDFVRLGDADASGLLPIELGGRVVTTSADSHSQVQKFHLLYKVGVGLKTNQPILAAFSDLMPLAR